MVQIRKPPVKNNVYRHFAVITIVVTLLLAVFADGENREALADGVSDEIAARQETDRIETAQIAKFGKPKLIQRNRVRGGAGRSDYDGSDAFDSGYGNPMDPNGQDSGGAALSRARFNPSAKMPASYAPYGIPQAEWNAMSEEEREEFLRRRTPPKPAVSAEQHRREVEGLLAASAARAGESSQDE